jgi:hypothetical protein
LAEVADESLHAAQAIAGIGTGDGEFGGDDEVSIRAVRPKLARVLSDRRS